MEFLKSIIIDEETPAADGTYTYDLPVNPVSHLVLVIEALNLAAVEATIPELCAMVTNIHVLHRGTTVLQMTANELLALNHILYGKTPLVGNQSAAINETRWVALVIPFGRYLYTPDECFPQSRAGELQIQLTVDILTAAATGLILHLEALELYGANPARHLKVTTLALAAATIGDNDFDLPIGNDYAGVMLYGTTKPDGVLWTTTINRLKLLANNKESYFSATAWEALRGELLNRPGLEPGYIAAHGHDHIPNYAFLDFDPAHNDVFLMHTAGLNALKLRITSEDTEEIRVFPLELVSTR